MDDDQVQKAAQPVTSAIVSSVKRDSEEAKRQALSALVSAEACCVRAVTEMVRTYNERDRLVDLAVEKGASHEEIREAKETGTREGEPQ